MFHESYKEDWRVFEEVLRVFKGSFKDVSWKFHGRESFKDVSSVFHDFQGCFQSVSKKFQENFQGVSKKFHVAWHSSQLPEQKEGLFKPEKISGFKIILGPKQIFGPKNFLVWKFCFIQRKILVRKFFFQTGKIFFYYLIFIISGLDSFKWKNKYEVLIDAWIQRIEGAKFAKD